MTPLEPSVGAFKNRKIRAGGSRRDRRVGTRDDKPWESESFDFVYMAFCLCLTDRPLLLKSVRPPQPPLHALIASRR